MKRFVWLLPALYILFLLLPIYWLLNMSFKNTNEILGSFTLWPRVFTLENYRKIFTNPTWYGGYLNSLGYVLMNTVTSGGVSLPAAYAFSRYRFLGDKHLFFWLLTNRMAPPAVFALPFFQLYSAIGLFDTRVAVALAHCLFNIPLAVWILEGFMSGVPKELDETAFVDGYPFWRFFIRIFIPTLAPGVGVATFFCFMFSWVELLLAKTLTSVDAKPIAATMTRTASTSATSWACSPRRARSPSSRAPSSSTSCATTSPRASRSAAFEGEAWQERRADWDGWRGRGKPPSFASSSGFSSPGWWCGNGGLQEGRRAGAACTSGRRA